jgi:hypothetical protein
MIEAKIQPIRRDLDIAFQSWLGPEARADILIDTARGILAETDAQNASALGQNIPHETFVDGVRTEAIERVHADGVIVRTYDLMPLVLMEIGHLLWTHSPYLTGRYQKSHRLLADGVEIAKVTDGWSLPALPTGVREFSFIPTVDYARPIERGWSKKAPDGVYQVVTVMPSVTAFSRYAKISFGYRELAGMAESKRERKARPGAPRDMRQPVIIVRPS